MIKFRAKLIYLFAFLLLSAFYLVTAPENRIEVDDAFWFAAHVRDLSLVQLLRPRYLLFLPINSLIYKVFISMGVPILSYALMSLVSMISAVLTLLLFARLLQRSFAVSPLGSAVAAGLLSVTYGFWRYAVEAEVYATAMLLTIGSFSLVAWSCEENQEQGPWRAAIAGVLSGAAVLFYQPNLIPLFLALPVLYLRKKHLPLLVSYLTVAAVIILGGYAAAYLAVRPPALSFLDFVLSAVPAQVNANPIKILFAFGSNILSANWIFGFDAVSRFLETAFPNQVIVEEVYAAKTAGFLRLVPLLTLPAIVITLLSLILVLRRFRTFASPSRELLAVLIWLAIYIPILYKGSPTAPEAWIMILMPLMILIACYLVEPCLQLGRVRLLVAFTVLVMLHNLIGGIGIIHSRDGDYYAVKAQWVLKNTTTADALLTGGSIPFTCYLSYFAPARVVNVVWMSTQVSSAVERVHRNGGNVFALDDAFNPPSGMKSDYPQAYALVKRLLSSVEADAIKVFESPVGDTFRIVFEPLVLRETVTNHGSREIGACLW
jgi:hypothetical protein